MTPYEILCCYQSPAWYNYCNLLNTQYNYVPQKVELSLPETVTDSYLGRLVTLAKLVNSSWDSVTEEHFSEYIKTLQLFAVKPSFSVRPWNAKLRYKTTVFLHYKLPASWLSQVVEPFMVELYTEKVPKSDFNNRIYLETLRKVSTSMYPAVIAWFKLHPHALDERTRYEDNGELHE